MNSTETTAPFRPSASEYILDYFEATDRIAILVLKRDSADTIQRTESRKPRIPVVAWLQKRERLGYLCRNEPAQERCMDADQGGH